MGIPVEFFAATVVMFAFTMIIHAAQLLPYMASGEPFYRTFIVGIAVLMMRSGLSLLLMVIFVRGALGEFGSDVNSRTVVAGGGLIIGLLMSIPLGELLTRFLTGVQPKGLLWGREEER